MADQQTFDSAYSKLETTIRNFSREKISYESNIAKQNLTITSLKSEVEILSRNVQTLQTEKQYMENTWKQDDEHRCSVEAALIESEKKIDAYWISLQQFENVALSINQHIEILESTIQTCKRKQVELLDHILTTEKIREEEKITFNDKLQSLEKQLESEKNSAATVYREYDEKVNILNQDISGLQSSLQSKKIQYENIITEHNSFVKNLRNSHENQILEKEVAFSVVEQKYLVAETQLNTSLTNANVALEKKNIENNELKTQVYKLKLALEDEEKKYGNTIHSHIKTVEEFHLDRHKLLQEKEQILVELQEKDTEIGNLNCSINSARVQLEEKDEQMTILELQISNLQLSVQNHSKSLEGKKQELCETIKHFENRCNDYESQLNEKDVLFCATNCKLSVVEEEMNISLSEANAHCQDYLAKIKDLESNTEEKKILIEHLEKVLAEKEESIILLNQKIINSEQKLFEVGQELQSSLTTAVSQINETNAKVIALDFEIKGLQLSLQNEKEKLENTVKDHHQITNDHQTNMKEKEKEITGLKESSLDKEENWKNSFNDLNLQLELSSTKIRDLNKEIAELQIYTVERENELQAKCRHSDSTIEEITQTYKTEIDEKNTRLSDLNTKLFELEHNTSVSLKSVNKRFEDSCSKLRSLETEMKTKEHSIATLQKSLSERDVTITSLERDIEDLRRTVEEYRKRSHESFNNFKEICAAKENMEEVYEVKLNTLKKALNDRCEELSNLKAMCHSRERAITKFMIETTPTIPVLFQNQLPVKVKQRPPATATSTTAVDKGIRVNRAESDNGNKVVAVPPLSNRTSPIYVTNNPKISFTPQVDKEKVLGETSASLEQKFKELMKSNHQKHSHSSSKTKILKDKASPLKKVHSKGKIEKKGILKPLYDNQKLVEKKKVRFLSPIAFFKSPPELNLKNYLPHIEDRKGALKDGRLEGVGGKRSADDYMQENQEYVEGYKKTSLLSRKCNRSDSLTCN